MNRRAPINLLNVRPDQPVEVKVAHRLQEEYKPPPKSAAVCQAKHFIILISQILAFFFRPRTTTWRDYFDIHPRSIS